MKNLSTSLQSRTPDASGADTDGEEEEDDPEKLDDFIEGTSRGIVKGNIMMNYFRAGLGIPFGFFLLFMFILTQVVTSANDYYVRVL